MQSIHVRYKKQLKKFGIDLLFLCITYLQTARACLANMRAICRPIERDNTKLRYCIRDLGIFGDY